MKKIAYLLSAVSALFLTGCQDGKEPVSPESTLVATVVTEGAVTRVEMTPADGKLEWQGGDTLAVCSSKKGRGSFVPFAIIGGGRSNVAEFRGEIADSSIKDCAVYPYISGKEPYFKDGELYVTVPESVQRWEGATMAPLYASIGDYKAEGSIFFKKLGAILRVEIDAIPANTCELTVIASRKISGDFKVVRDPGTTAYIAAGEPSGVSDCEMSLTFAPLAAAQEKMFFNFPLPVGDYSYLRFQAKSADGTVVGAYRTAVEISLSRGEIRNVCPGDDPLPRFNGTNLINVPSIGATDATFKVKIKNNAEYGWVLTLESFSGCVSAASLDGTTLTYSVPSEEASPAVGTGTIVLKLSDPTGVEAPLYKTFIVTRTVKPEHYFVKVTEDKENWEGQYLVVYEMENEAYVMYTNSNFSDLDCQSFIADIEPDGIGYTKETSAGLLTIKKHAPDPSGAVHKTPVEGKYTLFIDGTVGIGRYAQDAFGFNNNGDYGRFVHTIGYDKVNQCVKISCLTKAGKDAYLKFDSGLFTFGMGLESEIRDPRFADVQLYELK